MCCPAAAPIRGRRKRFLARHRSHGGPTRTPLEAITALEKAMRIIRLFWGDERTMLLERLVGKIILRRDGDRLVAEFAGNLSGILDLEDFGKYGAGRGFVIYRSGWWRGESWRKCHSAVPHPQQHTPQLLDLEQLPPVPDF
jgi:hypothetical protein